MPFGLRDDGLYRAFLLTLYLFFSVTLRIYIPIACFLSVPFLRE